MSDAPRVAGHTFVHTAEGWKCERCDRLWCNVVARQPSWPGHVRMDDSGNRLPEPSTEGIACVGDLNTQENEQIDAEKRRIWEALCEAAGFPLRTVSTETEDEHLMGYCG